MTKNTIIYEVGKFPVLHERYHIDFPEGIIVLKYGEHKRANRGFGVVHILAEHTSDLKKYALEPNEKGVADYVALIISSGAKIFSEFSGVRGNHRPMIIKSSVGTVVLEKQDIEGKTVYSVVSAFGRKTGVGTQIGTIK